MNPFSHVPPGFRFHPTDEELVDYYLRKKVACKKIDLDVIKDVDLYKIEPWDLQELCGIGIEEQNEWYFFSHKDKKYPTGTRTNRATKVGFWKATGRDKAIYARHSLVGMRKTLVFYKGRAPNGQKSDWIMHEYRLETNENGTPQEEGWAVCRVFKKRMPATQRMDEFDSSSCIWYDHQLPFVPPESLEASRRIPQPYGNLVSSSQQLSLPCKQELELAAAASAASHNNNSMPSCHYIHEPLSFLQMPRLESPSMPRSSNNSITYVTQDEHSQQHCQRNLMNPCPGSNIDEQTVENVTDWRVLDIFMGNNNEDAVNSKEAEGNYTSASSFQGGGEMDLLENGSKRVLPEVGEEYNSASGSSSCQIDLWK